MSQKKKSSCQKAGLERRLASNSSKISLYSSQTRPSSGSPVPSPSQIFMSGQQPDFVCCEKHVLEHRKEALFSLALGADAPAHGPRGGGAGGSGGWGDADRRALRARSPEKVVGASRRVVCPPQWRRWGAKDSEEDLRQDSTSPDPQGFDAGFRKAPP